MVQTVSYFIQLGQILFLCRHMRRSHTLCVVVAFIACVAIIGIDRRTFTAEWLSWVSAFLIALHYVMLTAVSIYFVIWLMIRNKYPEDEMTIQAVVLCVALICTLFGFCNGIYTKVNAYTINTDKVDSDLRIIHLSDLHLNTMFDAEDIAVIVDKVNELNPDIVCITGDVFDGWRSFAINLEDVYKEFRRLNPTYGTYVSYGNHDVVLLDELTTLCNKSGFRLLIDNEVQAGGVNIIGRACSPDGMTLDGYDIDNAKFNIVLDHIPDRIYESVGNNVDLALCGHTHGGQLLSIKLMFDMKYPIDSGGKQIKNTFAIVNQGAYLIYPYCRIFGRSEIVCIDVKCNK